MLEINSVNNSLIKKYYSLKNKKYRDELKLFILDDIDLIKIANDKGLLDTILYYDELDFKVSDNTNLIKVNKNIIEKLSFVKTPRNVIGICNFIKENNIDSNKIVALDNVQDPGNGGTILRSALAFNFDEVLLSNKSFDIYNDKFIRATKGAIFDINIKRVELKMYLEILKNNGYEIVTLDLDQDAVKVNDFKLNDKVVLVCGAEGKGISYEIDSIKSYSVYIPISSKMESLNVSIAASIVMSKNNI